MLPVSLASAGLSLSGACCGFAVTGGPIDDVDVVIAEPPTSLLFLPLYGANGLDGNNGGKCGPLFELIGGNVGFVVDVPFKFMYHDWICSF